MNNHTQVRGFWGKGIPNHVDTAARGATTGGIAAGFAELVDAMTPFNKAIGQNAMDAAVNVVSTIGSVAAYLI